MKGPAINPCDSTFNGQGGCTRVSPGCDNCYAETQDDGHVTEPISHLGNGRTPAGPRCHERRWSRLQIQSNQVGFCMAVTRLTTELKLFGADDPRCAVSSARPERQKRPGRMVSDLSSSLELQYRRLELVRNRGISALKRD